MTSDQRSYYLKRAEVEVELANRAANAAAAKAHFQLAERYIGLARDYPEAVSGQLKA